MISSIRSYIHKVFFHQDISSISFRRIERRTSISDLYLGGSHGMYAKDVANQRDLIEFVRIFQMFAPYVQVSGTLVLNACPRA